MTGLLASVVFVAVAMPAPLTLQVASADVQAACSIGVPGWHAAVRHAAPDIASPVLLQGGPSLAATMIVETSLSFLDL